MSAIVFFRTLFLFWAIVAASFALPVAAALILDEAGIALAFALPAAAVFAPAALLWLLGKKEKKASSQITAKSSFLLSACAWIGACALGAAPLYLSGAFPSISSAFFESASGFTTTGATCAADVEVLPVAVNLWRCEMQWLGGMGILGLTVAILQIPGIGAFQLIKTEVTGPEKAKLSPKVAETAKWLWAIYAGLTAALLALLLICGLPFLDALMHSFSIVSTGGFSSKNEGIIWYGSSAAEWISAAFMLISSINYSLHYKAITGRFKEIRANSELKAFLLILAAAAAALFASFFASGAPALESLRCGIFQAISTISTTGFASNMPRGLPALAQAILLLLMFTGACSGSTSGGIKVIRWLILAKGLSREVKRMLQHSGVYGIRIDGRPADEKAISSCAAFVFLYFALLAATALAAAACGCGIETSCTAALALVGNIGSGLGDVAPGCSYAFFPPAAKAWFSLAMIAGRLELYALLALFFPSFWKK